MKKKYIETFDGKIMPIKEIHEVLKTQDAPKIYKLYKSIYGKPATYLNMCAWIGWYGPTKKVKNAAMEIAMHSKPKIRFDFYIYYKKMIRNRKEFREANPIQCAMQNLHIQIARGINNESKLPVMGENELYFAHPVKKLDDHYKWYAMPITGNERFCETLCRYVEKYLKTHNSI